jgi:threonine/homoserine/homoserine lactone efflux protein
VAPLVVASLAIMGSPGPATISLAATVPVYGVRRSLRYVVGIVVGTMLVLVAVASGITAALLALPALRVVLIAVSAAYILRLAYRIATAPPLGATSASVAAPSFAGGALLGVANPKGWIAIAATFASAWVVVGASFAPVLRDARRARVVNLVLAVALVGATGLALVR